LFGSFRIAVISGKRVQKTTVTSPSKLRIPKISENLEKTRNQCCKSTKAKGINNTGLEQASELHSCPAFSFHVAIGRH
jgi:hypothetical protein